MMSLLTPSADRVIVTGAAGFIGYHVATRLLAEGAHVVGVDHLNNYYDPALKQARLDGLKKFPGFRFEKISLEDTAAIMGLWADVRPKIVIHLAAQAGVRYSLENPRAYIDSNVVGHLNVLEACRAVLPDHLIYASSSSVYGGNTKMPFHEDDPVDHPMSLYAATKKSGELISYTYSHLYGIPASGLRFFTVYGPWGRPDMAYFKFVRAMMAGEKIDVYNHGDMKRDFTYIEDVVESIVRLIPHAPTGPGAPHQIYNLGRHQPEDLMMFIRILEELTGRTAHLNMLPMQPGDVPATFADVSRLATVTGYEPRVSLRDGLAKFVDWYRGFYNV